MIESNAMMLSIAPIHFICVLVRVSLSSSLRLTLWTRFGSQARRKSLRGACGGSSTPCH